MDLWILSQDNECIMKVDRLDYDLSNYEHRIMANGYQTLVAKYATKKRAVEVLNDISSKIKNQFIVKVNCLMKPNDMKRIKQQLEMDYKGDFMIEDPATDIKPINQNIIFYEMPKE